jgi:hypothetical protein
MSSTETPSASGAGVDPAAAAAPAAAPELDAPELDALELDEEERELVAQDIEVLLPTLDGDRRQRYARLRDAVLAGSVPPDMTPALESLLELTLQTARARTRYRAEGEQTLTKLYSRTAGGRELAAHLRQVNKALGSLSGQTVESVAVRMRTVGHFTIAIQTSGTTITLAARPDSIDVESIAVGT